VSEYFFRNRSARWYTKSLVAVNCFLCWGLVYLSVFQGYPDLAKYALGTVITIIGIYTGIGHAEFRKAADVESSK
jgi:hypothetical protein